MWGAWFFLLGALASSGCGAAGEKPPRGEELPSALLAQSHSGGRTASYVIRRHRLEQNHLESGLRAKLVLSDENSAPLAHVLFWDDGRLDPEKHWNREPDLERCPKCHPQYDLHFPSRALEPVLRHLRSVTGTVRLTHCNDDWAIETPGSALAPVWAKP